MRKSILACTVSFLMSPMASWALGMGDIQVNSILNQPLNAEIALHSVTKKDLDLLRVGLAPKSIYSRANIERSGYLSKFKFKIIQRGNKHYVVITTKKPFREPFANFLIEATWSSGRLLREYTMLLDPPEFIKKQARRVTTASASQSSQVKRSRTTNTKKSSTSKKSDYVLTPGDGGQLSYGPTQKNDTLWVIAKQMAPANVSVNQMMMALLRDNPDAFIGNNINNLKSGYVLRIKDQASLNKLSRSMANSQVKEQYQNWKNTRKQKTNGNVVDRSAGTVESAPAGGQLKLVTSGSADNAGVDGDLSAQAKQLKDKLVLASEELESKEIQNEELRTRVKELEELLKTKTSLIELKDESLAALQKQKQIQEITEKEANDKILADEQSTESETESESESTLDAQPTESITDSSSDEDVYAKTKALLSQPIDSSVELSKDEIAEESVPEVEPLEINEVLAETKPLEIKEILAEVSEPKSVAPKIEDKTKPVEKPKPVVKETPKPLPQENVIDILLSEDMLPYTAGGGGLLVLIFAWLGLRGRGKKDNDFEESILDSQIIEDESDFGIEDSELVESSTEVLASDNETSFLSDFSADDMESLQPDDTEADPISEADVFMVYGRYQQAEELLQGAIKKEPERLDFQMKLLEVYHGDNLKDSFAVQADVIKGLLQKTNDDYELTSEWIKAKSWAEKLDLNIDMPESFDEDISLDEESTIEKLNDLDDVELSSDDLSDELSLDSEELNLNNDSILGDDNFSDEELSLSLDDLDIDNESELNTEILDLDESTLNADASETDSTLELDDISDLELDDSLELESNLELDDSLELEGDSPELDLDDNLELESDLELDNSLELESEGESPELDLDDNLELESDFELDDSLELESEGESPELDLDDDNLELESDLELDDSLELETEGESPEFELDDKLELDNDDQSDIMLELDDSDTSLATSEDDLELFDSDTDFDDLDDDFPELDAVGTKLDLAKAYIDMGDTESASSILNEVIDEGNEEQKSQAQSLLDQAAS